MSFVGTPIHPCHNSPCFGPAAAAEGLACNFSHKRSKLDVGEQSAKLLIVRSRAIPPHRFQEPSAGVVLVTDHIFKQVEHGGYCNKTRVGKVSGGLRYTPARLLS